MRILIIPFGGFFEAVRSVHALALHRGIAGGPGSWRKQQVPTFPSFIAYKVVNGGVGGKGEKSSREYVCSLPSYKLLENTDL